MKRLNLRRSIIAILGATLFAVTLGASSASAATAGAPYTSAKAAFPGEKVTYTFPGSTLYPVEVFQISYSKGSHVQGVYSNVKRVNGTWQATFLIPKTICKTYVAPSGQTLSGYYSVGAAFGPWASLPVTGGVKCGADHQTYTPTI